MLVELSKPGMVYASRVHVKGCADIAKDKRKGYTDSFDFDGTYQQWKEETFGDVASDEIDADTQREEWLREVDFQASESVCVDCVKKAGLER